jgi:molybdopterin-containing oxidoreductase family iron-sulfur binding subunit
VVGWHSRTVTKLVPRGSMTKSQAGPVYWRSLDELENSPSFRRFVEDEFPGLWDRYSAEHPNSGTSRRQFLKLMGASCALAGLTACRWPKENIVPATRQPGNRIPGVPVQYATAFELNGAATGLLVTSYDGRPIKIEGNDKHPFSRGRSSAWMQASLLDLYDPDRSPQPVERSRATRLREGEAVAEPRPREGEAPAEPRPREGEAPAEPRPREGEAPAEPHGVVTRTWDEFQAFARSHFASLRDTGGQGLCVLSESSSSPSLAAQKARLLEVFPRASWYEYEPISRDNEREGARLAFGQPYRTHLHLDKADVIVSLDSDFLMLHPAAVRYAGDFAARRRADDGTMNRLYVFEGGLTVTGSNADHRLAVRPSQIAGLLQQLSGGVISRRAGKGGGRVHIPELPLPRPILMALAAEFDGREGRSAILVGPQQPPNVHWLAHDLNQRLGNVGKTVTYTDEPDPARLPHLAALQELTTRMQAGEVDTLIIIGGNPVLNAPRDLPFGDALDKVGTSLHLSLYDNETSVRCRRHVPAAHYLESWGDARAWDGTISIVQPLIEPLYGGLTPIELLAVMTGDELAKGYDIVRRTAWQERLARESDPEQAWQHALHDGVVPDTVWPQRTPELKPWVAEPTAKPEPGFEIVFTPDYSVYDGRFANNAWLQEWPDPITKLTWDNAALVSPADAAKLGVEKSGDHLEITLAGAPPLTIPACVLPGHAVGVITLPLGYGRGPAGGKVADGIGFATHGLRQTATQHWATAREVRRKSGSHELATTQDHHAIRSKVGDEEERLRIPVLVREATLEHYDEHPDFAQHVVHLPKLESLWQEKQYNDHKWGLAIDLTACIGCGACVVACQAENNIPVVGKDEVAKGREMHWIRVDRYFREERPSEDAKKRRRAAQGVRVDQTALTDFRVVHQPVACVHCENAPCEQVCPVAATVHDEEGLNVMVYNRCIGTRYCSNNCPFKVRRFNWFYNQHGPYHPRSLKGGESPAPGLLPHATLTPVEMMGNNPNVTVRSRGVMEKCTFCVQRINAVKIKAANERWTSIPDGLITPACAQACPTDAIVFGDLNDPHSRVRKLHAHNRAYGLLEELNIKPRTKYLAKLRNPNESDTLG